MTERQQRNRTERSNAMSNAEMQPNNGAPSLRNERERRDWIEAELDLCNQSWVYQKVLDGEIAQRSEAARCARAGGGGDDVAGCGCACGCGGSERRKLRAAGPACAGKAGPA